MACKYYIKGVEISEDAIRNLFAEAIAEVEDYSLDKVLPLLSEKINNYSSQEIAQREEKVTRLKRLVDKYNEFTLNEKKGAGGNAIMGYIRELSKDTGYSFKARNKGNLTLLNEKGKEVRREAIKRTEEEVAESKTEAARIKGARTMNVEDVYTSVAQDVVNGLRFYKKEFQDITGIENPDIKNNLIFTNDKQKGQSFEFYMERFFANSGNSWDKLDANQIGIMQEAATALSDFVGEKGHQKAKDHILSVYDQAVAKDEDEEFRRNNFGYSQEDINQMMAEAELSEKETLDIMHTLDTLNPEELIELEELTRNAETQQILDEYGKQENTTRVEENPTREDNESQRRQKEKPKVNEKKEAAKQKIIENADRLLSKFGATKNLLPEQKTELIQDVKGILEGVAELTYEEIKELLFPVFNKLGLSEKEAYEVLDESIKDMEIKQEEKATKPKEKAKPSSPSERNKTLLNRAYDAVTDLDIAKIIESLGLTYVEMPNEVSNKKADEFLNRVGYENAKANLNSLEGATKAMVWGKLIDLANEGINNAQNQEELAKYSNDLRNLLDTFDREARSAGRFLQALPWVYRNSSFGYSLEAVEKRFTAANGGIDVSPELKQQLKDSVAKIEQLEKEIENANEAHQKEVDALIMKNIQDQIDLEKKLKKSPSTRSQKPSYNAQQRIEKAIDVTKSLRAKLRAQNYSDATGMVAVIDTGLGVLETTLKATKNVAKAIDAAIEEIDKQLNGAKWNKDKFRKDVEAEYAKEGIDINEEVTDKQNIPHALIKELVEGGIDNIEDLVEAVNKEMGIENTPENIRKTRDDITGYGQTLQYERPEIEEKISQLKGVGRLLSAIEDVKNGLRSKRSGVQRRQLIEKERTLMKQLRELTKNLPIDEADLAKYHKTALDALKKRMRNRIEELNAELDRAKEIGAEEALKEKQGKVNKRTELDAEALLIQEELEETKKLHDEAFKDIPESLEEKIQRIVTLIENSERKYQQKIDQGAFFPSPKEERPDDPRITAAQQKLDAKKQEFEAKKAAAEPANYAEEKKIAKLQQELDDLLNGKYNGTPPRQSNPDSQRIKDLKQQIYDAKVNLGILLSPFQTELNRKIAAKRNAIAKVEQQLLSGNLVPNRPQSNVTSFELERLKNEHEALLDELVEARKTDPAYLKSVELRKEAASIKADEKKLQDLKDKNAANNLEKQKAKNKADQTLQQRLRKFKIQKQQAILDELREAAGIPERELIAKAEKAKEKKLQELRHRRTTKNLEKGTFTTINGILGRFKPQKKRELPSTQRIKNLNAQLAKEQRELDLLEEKVRLEQRTKVEKLIDTGIASSQIFRTLMATGEFSGIGVQGFKPIVTRPTLAFKALKNMFSQFFSQEKTEKFENNIESSPYYDEMLGAKLAITNPLKEGILKAHEEALASSLLNGVWNQTVAKGLQYAPDVRQLYQMIKDGEYKALGIDAAEAANVLKSFERAQSGLLNTLRVEMYLAGREMLVASGKTFETHPKEFKDLASVVNQSTGRANLGALETSNSLLNLAFFSIRNFVSLINNVPILNIPYYFSLGQTEFTKADAGFSSIRDSIIRPSVAQKMFLGDLAKFYAFIIGATALTATALARYNDDDEDEKRVELNPLSSDFGSIKLTNTTRFSYAGQLRKLIVFATRMMSGKLVNKKGETKFLGENNTKTRGQLTTGFLSNRLSPTLGFAANYLSKEEQEDGTFINTSTGKEYDIIAELNKLKQPIYFGTATDIIEREENVKVKAASLALAGLGFDISLENDANPLYYAAQKNQEQLSLLTKNGLLISTNVPLTKLPSEIVSAINKVAKEKVEKNKAKREKDPSVEPTDLQKEQLKAKDAMFEAYNLISASPEVRDIILERDVEKQEELYKKYRNRRHRLELRYSQLKALGLTEARAKYLAKTYPAKYPIIEN